MHCIENIPLNCEGAIVPHDTQIGPRPLNLARSRSAYHQVGQIRRMAVTLGRLTSLKGLPCLSRQTITGPRVATGSWLILDRIAARRAMIVCQPNRTAQVRAPTGPIYWHRTFSAPPKNSTPPHCSVTFSATVAV